MGGGPMTVSATAATIVKNVQSLYQVTINCTLAAEQVVVGFLSQLCALVDQPLSPEAELQLYKQLQDMQLKNR